MNFDLINQEMDKVLAFANALCKEHNEWNIGKNHKEIFEFNRCLFDFEHNRLLIRVLTFNNSRVISGRTLEELEVNIKNELLNSMQKLLYLNYEQDECPITDDLKLNGC